MLPSQAGVPCSRTAWSIGPPGTWICHDARIRGHGPPRVRPRAAPGRGSRRQDARAVRPGRCPRPGRRRCAQSSLHPAAAVRSRSREGPGVRPRMFADALRAATRHADAAFAELGLDAAARGSLRGRAEEWRVQLLSEAPPPNPVVSGDRLPEAAHRPTSEPAPEKPRWPSSNPPPASTGPGQEPPAVR